MSRTNANYVHDLQWLKLSNKVLRAPPSSPRQREIVAQRAAREVELDALVAKAVRA